MRILCVDDETSLLLGVKSHFEQDGHVVDVAPNGDDGFWYATEHDYDALVVDLMMSGRNGFQLVSDLRRAAVDTPILVLTAKQGDLDEEEALEVGADDYLRKPFAVNVLKARVHALVRRSGQHGRGYEDSVRSGDLELNTRTGECVVDGSEVLLTPREFSLLRALMSPPEQLHTKTDLLQDVWGTDNDQAGLLHVYVGYLRKKIDPPGGASRIETIPGRGYRLASDDSP